MTENRVQQLERWIEENKKKIARLISISPRMEDSICVANMRHELQEHQLELAARKGGAQ